MRLLLIGTACLIGQSVMACDELIQSCTFNNGAKVVRVCLDAGNVTYAYGPNGGSPELSLSVPIAVADYTPWPGVGRSIWETMAFHNGGFSYEVSAGFDRLQAGEDDPAPPYGSIVVLKGGTTITELTCDVGSVDWGYGDGGLFGAKTAAGQCWKDFAWKQCN